MGRCPRLVWAAPLALGELRKLAELGTLGEPAQVATDGKDWKPGRRSDSP